MRALIFSRDPGGANQMIGLYEALRAGSAHPGIRTIRDRIGPQPDYLVYAKDFAVPLWKGDGYDVTLFPGGPAEQLLRSERIGAVLTSTSDIDDETDRRLWSAAKALGIPSHAFVDGDFNVLRRFHDGDGNLLWPDHIYTPGTASAAPIRAAGHPDVTIIPDFPLLVQKRRAAASAGKAAALRAAWGVEGRKAVLFASENVMELAALGKEVHYSELACLERLLAGLAGRENVAGLQPDPGALVVIRPHPKENGSKYARYERPGAVLLSAAGSAVEAIMAADMVVGMNSTLLREALMLGKPTLSLVDARIHQADRP